MHFYTNKIYRNCTVDNCGQLDGLIYEKKVHLNPRFVKERYVDMSAELHAYQSLSSGSSFIFHQPAFYAGFLYSHYGHFILESLSRLSSYTNSLPLVWSATQTHLQDYQTSILKGLNISLDNILLVNKKYFFTELYVPAMESIICSQFSHRQYNFLSSFSSRTNVNNNCLGNIWLSRRRIYPCQIEARVESILASFGWSIIHPQNHSVSDQIDFFKHSNAIAGIQGSAFHTSVFIPKQYHQKIIMFSRANTDHACNNYQLINNAYGSLQTIYPSLSLSNLDQSITTILHRAEMLAASSKNL